MESSNSDTVNQLGVAAEHEIAAVGSFVLVDPQPGLTEAISHLTTLGHKRSLILAA